MRYLSEGKRSRRHMRADTLAMIAAVTFAVACVGLAALIVVQVWRVIEPTLTAL